MTTTIDRTCLTTAAAPTQLRSPRWATALAQRRAVRVARRVLVPAAWVGVLVLVALLATLTLMPKLADLRVVVINGVSMSESMPLHSAVVLKPVAPARVQVGDIISFDRPDEPGVRVTHRVVKMWTRDGAVVFRTKGDHNASVDPWRMSYVDGTAWRVVAHAPQVGRVLQAVQTPTARFLLVAAPIGVLLGMVFLSIWREPRAGNV